MQKHNFWRKAIIIIMIGAFCLIPMIPVSEDVIVEQLVAEEWAFEEVAAEMDVPPALVASVASFYTMLNRRPVGRHLIQICTNISCSLLGAERLAEHISHKLDIEPGETTVDGKFTLLEVECLGSCGTAPMMQVDDHYYESLTQDRVDEILASLD